MLKGSCKTTIISIQHGLALPAIARSGIYVKFSVMDGLRYETLVT
jgi:hypothetical protein